MSNEKPSTVEEYKKDCRAPCKYGSKCYQKNPQHHLKFKHPPKLVVTEKKAEAAGTKKRKIEEDVHEVEECCPSKQAKHTNDSDSPPASQSRSPSPHISPVASPDTTSSKATASAVTSLKKSPVKNDASPVTNAEYFTEDEVELPEDPTNLKDSLKQKFLVDMPKDFYKFWEFCEELKPSDPLCALSLCGLRLVGAYDVVANKSLTPRTQSRYVCHWRYYYDPPELQTVLAGDKGGFHIGYFRDDPSEEPVFLASMTEGKSPGTVTPVADNIFDAARMYCLQEAKSGSPFRQLPAQKLAKQLEEAAVKFGFKVDTKADAVKRRRSSVVCRSFHSAGIVVPYDKKTEVGYREVPETDASLRRMLQKVADAKSEEARKVVFTDVQELVTNAQWATDEGDFGMSLELGMALFIHGCPHLQKTAQHLMTVAYSLLQRDEFATILKAHLKNRRKGDKLSAFN